MKKRTLVNLLASVLTLAVTLVVLAGLFELGVRLFVDNGMNFNLEMWKYARDLKEVAPDPLVGHRHRPGRRARLMGVEVAINSNGLRDREIAYPRTPGSLLESHCRSRRTSSSCRGTTSSRRCLE